MRFLDRTPSRVTFLTLLALVTGLGSPSYAHGPASPEPASRAPVGCEAIFAQLPAETRTSLVSDVTATDQLVRKPTVEWGEKSPGTHGGQRLILKKKNQAQSWNSMFATMNYDQQGDPRWFIDTVGASNAEFFGFRLLDENTLMVPDPTEFMGALRKVNAELRRSGKEPLALSFYPTYDDSPISVATYVRMFREHHSIPMSESGNPMIHDLSFHAGSIFMPKSLLDYASEQLAFEKSFFDFLKKKYRVSEQVGDSVTIQQQLVRDLEYLFNFHETSQIDSGTAYFHLGVVDTAHLGSTKYQASPVLKRGTEWFVHDFNNVVTPAKRLEYDIGRLKGVGPFTEVSPTSVFLPGMNETKRQNIGRNLNTHYPVSAIHADLREFMASYQPARPALFDARRTYIEDWKVADREAFYERICREVTQKRLDVIQAIGRLKGP